MSSLLRSCFRWLLVLTPASLLFAVVLATPPAVAAPAQPAAVAPVPAAAAAPPALPAAAGAAVPVVGGLGVYGAFSLSPATMSL